jgi:hypothetical protein
MRFLRARYLSVDFGAPLAYKAGMPNRAIRGMEDKMAKKILKKAKKLEEKKSLSVRKGR